MVTFQVLASLIFGAILVGCLVGSLWRTSHSERIRRCCFVFLLLLVAIALLSLLWTRAFVQPSVMSSSQTPTSREDGHLVGFPTVTAAFINKVLATAGSPATGIGETMYKLGLEFGIDPVFPLAFFHHESNYGKEGIAKETKSIGNLRCTPGWTCDPTGGYRSYQTWKASVADWYRLIQEVYLSRGLDTIAEVIPVYAPSADSNNPDAYIQAVLADVTLWRSGRIKA